MNARSIAFFAVIWLVACGGAEVRPRDPGRAEPSIPAPVDYLGFIPGDTGRLAPWRLHVAYYTAVGAASPRAEVLELGETIGGNPFIAVLVSSAENVAAREELRRRIARLADPRGSQASELDSLIEDARPVVLVTCGVHAVEVGSPLACMRIVDDLVRSDDPETERILHDVIVLVVPALNPDGVDVTTDWYERTKGHPWEGSFAALPHRTHHYVNHDLNRDWLMLTQRETVLTVRHLYLRWHPQVVHDIHQLWPDGARLALPPYAAPVEPNVDPLLIASAAALGRHIAWQLGTEGRTGIVAGGVFDSWTPMRFFAHYHGAVRLLSETAGAMLASPAEVEFDAMRAWPPGASYDPRRVSASFPVLWPGGTWTLEDSVDTMRAGAQRLIAHVADNRTSWLRNFRRVNERAVAGWPEWPEAWLLPVDRHPARVQELVRVLVTAGVEVRALQRQVEHGERVFGPGSYLVPMRQPFASWAQALLQVEEYPRIVGSGGEIRPPYDVTAHNLPALFDVEALAVDSAGPLLNAVGPPVEPPETRRSPPHGLTFGRIGVYQSRFLIDDEGWVRWVLDANRVRFETVRDPDIRRSGLSERFDVIVVPSQRPDLIVRGHPEGTTFPEFAGGLGTEGIAALDAFVREGGTLVLISQASGLAASALSAALEDPLAGLGSAEFYCRGAIVKVRVEADALAGSGEPRTLNAFFERGSLAFEPRSARNGDTIHVLARYAADPLVAGFLEGPNHLSGRAAVLEIQRGGGRMILFGFPPQYRGHSLDTMPLFFEALAQRSG